MKKITKATLLAIFTLYTNGTFADVAVKDQTVKGAVDTVDNTLKDQLGGGSLSGSHGAADKGSVRANQVKQMELSMGDRKKDQGSLKPLDPKDRDYLNNKPGNTTYSGSSGYATAAQLPNSYCKLGDVDATNNTCTGGYKGAKSSSDSAQIRKDSRIDYSGSASLNDIKADTEKAIEHNAHQIAIYQAMAQEAYARTQVRYKNIQDMLDDIKNSKEPKEVLDLQARIQAEQAMLLNEQNQLLALGQLQQSQRDMHAQRMYDLQSFRRKHNTAKNSTPTTSAKTAAQAAIVAANAALAAALP